MKYIERIKTTLGTLKSLYFNVRREDLGACGTDVTLELPMKVTKPKNVYIGNHVAIRGFFTFISHTGRLIIKDYVGISQRFTVVTGNHTTTPPLNKWQVECNWSEFGDKESDTVIEEDVWIGINVTVMPGVTIGRGSIIGAGSVVTRSIPPYSIAVGNPCRVIKKKFTTEEIVERERLLYPEDKRLSIDVIENL